MFSAFYPNLRNSLPGISRCLDGERRNLQSSHHRTLDYIKVRFTVIGDDACSAEPETPFSAHLIIPELIPHAYIIEPDPGNKDHEKDNHPCKGNTHINPVSF